MNPDRKDFLLAMYNQMWSNINRHILVVWQSVGLVIATLALYSAFDKDRLPLVVVTMVVVVVSTWSIRHVYDSHVWYHRNLAIVSNIEREFLRKEDRKKISYYIEKHRPPEKILYHLKTQLMLAYGIIILSILYYILHIINQDTDKSLCDIMLNNNNIILSIIIICCGIIINNSKDRVAKKNIKFSHESPGPSLND